MTYPIAKTVFYALYYDHATKDPLSAYSIVLRVQVIGTYTVSKEKAMQNQQYVRQSDGAKAITIDKRAELVKIRLLQLMAVILAAAFAGGLRLIFAH